MSARQAKRLSKLAAQNKAEEEVDESSEEELEMKKPASAGFSFLMDSDSDSDESDNDSDNEEEECTSVVETKPVEKSPPPKPSKNKKKNGKQKKHEEEDVDALLDSLSAQTQDMNVSRHETPQYQQIASSLFGVQLKFINADKEMKRLFGVRGGRDTLANRQRRDPRQAGNKVTKRVHLVTPLDEWPRPPTFVGGGIRWSKANKPSGAGWSSFCRFYEVTWSLAYEKSQKEFETLQQTHDPNMIGMFLQRYPFHIDALLQMSEVFQHHGQMDHASDCIKRCVYALELAWSPDFDVTKGDCRMDINVEHNDGFFKALFLLMKQVGRRGCSRSAFETARLLLSMDPTGDPMNVLLAIDYYALTAKEGKFIVDLMESHSPVVDRHDDSRNKEEVTVDVLPGLQFSLALAYALQDDKEKAKEQLAKALIRFPTVLRPLLDASGINVSSPSWKQVRSHQLFMNCKRLPDSSVLSHLLDIYVTRHASLWKVTMHQGLLLQAAELAVSSESLQKTNKQVTVLPDVMDKYMRATVADFSDEVTTLPQDHPMMQQPQLPNGQQMDQDQAQAAIADIQAQQAAGQLPADANPVLLFLQSLMPWNNFHPQEE